MIWGEAAAWAVIGQRIRILSDKAEQAGITAELVNERGSSSTCPNLECRRRVPKPRGRGFSCPHCGFHGHRDLVGAANIAINNEQFLGTGKELRIDGAQGMTISGCNLGTTNTLNFAATIPTSNIVVRNCTALPSIGFWDTATVSATFNADTFPASTTVGGAPRPTFTYWGMSAPVDFTVNCGSWQNQQGGFAVGGHMTYTVNAACGPDAPGGQVLDSWGGLHPFGSAVPVGQYPYWRGWDIARDMALQPGQLTSGYTLDAWGGIHPFGAAPAVPIVPLQPDHQQGFPEMKFCIACHLGGALLRGLTVSRTDSSAPHSPY